MSLEVQVVEGNLLLMKIFDKMKPFLKENDKSNPISVCLRCSRRPQMAIEISEIDSNRINDDLDNEVATHTIM